MPEESGRHSRYFDRCLGLWWVGKGCWVGRHDLEAPENCCSLSSVQLPYHSRRAVQSEINSCVVIVEETACRGMNARNSCHCLRR
jgi:hypothetical protein